MISHIRILFIILSLTCFHLLLCRTDGDLKKSHYWTHLGVIPDHMQSHPPFVTYYRIVIKSNTTCFATSRAGIKPIGPITPSLAPRCYYILSAVQVHTVGFTENNWAPHLLDGQWLLPNVKWKISLIWISTCIFIILNHIISIFLS
jgi:hypothetical protein